MSLKALGGRSCIQNPRKQPQASTRQRDSQSIKYLCWNTGGLTSGVWEELLSQLADPEYAEVSLVILQETHWRGVSQFTRDCWHVISSGSNGEKGAGVAVMVRKTLCQTQSLRYTEVQPGRILHVRVPGETVSLDIISVYQFVWRSAITTEANKSPRQKLLDQLEKHLRHLPHRSTLLIAGDFNSQLSSDKRHVGPCTIKGPRLRLRSVRPFQNFLEAHQLTALNTWSTGKPATHLQGNSVSQIDFALGRIVQASGRSKSCKPIRSFQVASWREGSRHLPLLGWIHHERSYTASRSKPYDVLAMDYDFRTGSGRTDLLTQKIDECIERTAPRTWSTFTRALSDAAMEVYPKAAQHTTRAIDHFRAARAVQNVPQCLHVISDQIPDLKLRISFHTWKMLASARIRAKNSKKIKQAQKQEQLDAALDSALKEQQLDGGHSLFKTLKKFSKWKPVEKVQLRDPQGRFLRKTEEIRELTTYSTALFGTGEDFPLGGGASRLSLTADDMLEQLSCIKIGKAVPFESAPISAWRSCSRGARQRIAEIMEEDAAKELLPTDLTSSQIAWLPKPGKKPDTPEKLRPIGVIAPEGKILAGHVRKLIKDRLCQSVNRIPQFGFVPNRGTEEAVSRALKHMDEGRRTHCLYQRKAGSKFQGPQLIGSLTLSVDMSKAFDMVDRTLLRKALEDIQMDPELIEIIGKLHVDALYKMTVDGTDFSVMTKRGIKQGCKLAPSLFAISTALFFKRMAEKIGATKALQALTLYADDTLLQEHFRNKKEFEQALTHCSVLLKTLAEMGFKVNPKKSALLITVTGSSAQQELAKYRVKIKGEGDHLKLPDGNLIPVRRTAPY